MAGVCVCAHLASSSSAFPEHSDSRGQASCIFVFVPLPLKIVGPSSFLPLSLVPRWARCRSVAKDREANSGRRHAHGNVDRCVCARTHSRRWCPWPRLSSSLRARRSLPCSWRLAGDHQPARDAGRPEDRRGRYAGGASGCVQPYAHSGACSLAACMMCGLMCLRAPSEGAAVVARQAQPGSGHVRARGQGEGEARRGGDETAQGGKRPGPCNSRTTNTFSSSSRCAGPAVLVIVWWATPVYTVAALGETDRGVLWPLGRCCDFPTTRRG